MSREKKIEEIEKDIPARIFAYDLRENSANIDEKHRRIVAECIYRSGYRRASDTAREIFAEIEEGVKAAVSALQFENNPIHRKVKHETYSGLMRFIKTVEQKYTEGER